MYAFQSCDQQLSEQFGSRQGEPHRPPDYVNWRLGGFESIKDNLHNTDIEKAFDLPKRRAPDSKAGRNRCMRYSRTICAKVSSDRYALFSGPRCETAISLLQDHQRCEEYSDAAQAHRDVSAVRVLIVS